MPNRVPDANQVVNGTLLMSNKNTAEFDHQSINASIEASSSPDLSSLNKSPALTHASECHSTSEVSIAIPHGSPASTLVSIAQPAAVSKWRKFFPKFSAAVPQTSMPQAQRGEAHGHHPSQQQQQQQQQATALIDPSTGASQSVTQDPSRLATEHDLEARKSSFGFGPNVFNPEEKDPEGKETDIMRHFTQELALARSFYPERLKALDLIPSSSSNPPQLSSSHIEASSLPSHGVIRVQAPSLPEPSESSPFPQYEAQIIRQLVDLKKTSLKVSDLSHPSEPAQATGTGPQAESATNAMPSHCGPSPQFELAFNYESSCPLVRVKIFFKATESDFSLPDPLIYTSETSLPFQDMPCSESESGLAMQEFKCRLGFDLNAWQAIELSLQHLDPDSLDAISHPLAGVAEDKPTHTNRYSVISYVSDMFRFDADDEKLAKGKPRSGVAQLFKRKPKAATPGNSQFAFVKSQYIWPLIIVLEGEGERCTAGDLQAMKQATFAVFEKRPDGGFEIKVQKQKMMTQDGLTFLLSEIYGNKVKNATTANEAQEAQEAQEALETHEEPSSSEQDTAAGQANQSPDNSQTASPPLSDELLLRGSLIQKNIDILMKRPSKEINLQTLQSLHRVGSSSTLGTLKGRAGSTSTIDDSPTLYILNHLRRSEMHPSRESFGSVYSASRLSTVIGRNSSRLSNDRLVYLGEQTSALRLSCSPKEMEEGGCEPALCSTSNEALGPDTALATTAEPTEYDFKECVICLSEPSDTVLFPCRHWCLCQDCADVLRKQSKKCPLCRQGIESLIALTLE